MILMDQNYDGLLVIGDPHLEGRQPGFRKDDYPAVILEKLQWSLNYAARHQLLPVLLGDIFQYPRDNPTWMLTRLIEIMLGQETIGIYGNHDCAETTLTDHDSLSILVRSGCLQLVDYKNPWHGEMAGRPVWIGGSSYRQVIPDRFDCPVSLPKRQTLFDGEPLVVWLTHHDIEIESEGNGRLKPREIPNIDLVINGHIHKKLDPVCAGGTCWITPGNISRRSRHERNRDRVPQVLRIDVTNANHELTFVEVPHQPFDEVFHQPELVVSESPEHSGFVAGLKDLLSRKTQSGAGLSEFLNNNLDQFEPPVAEEISCLANEIMKR